MPPFGDETSAGKGDWRIAGKGTAGFGALLLRRTHHEGSGSHARHWRIARFADSFSRHGSPARPAEFPDRARRASQCRGNHLEVPMEKVLNQTEIDEMVRAARSGNAAGSAGPVIQPWDIRQAGQIGSEQLRAINQLHENFARNLSTAVGGFLRIVFDCSLVSAEHLTYREFLQRVPETTYLASCGLAPAGAVAVLQLDLTIAFPIIDVMLGGEGKSGEITRDITEIEEQVLEGVVRILCRELQTAWQAIALEFNFGARQQLLQTQRLMPPEEKNLCLSFEIKMPETRGTLNLAIPA